VRGVPSPRGCLLGRPWAGRGGTDDRPEPAPGGWAPGRLACRAAIVAQEKGCEPRRSRLESAPRLVPGTAPGPDGFSAALRDINWGQRAGAPQAGPWESVTPMRFHPSASRFREQRGSDAPAAVAFLSAGAGEPRPTRPRFRDKDQRFAWRWPVPDARVASALVRPHGAERGDRSVGCWADRGTGKRVFMASHANGERARRWPG
jgi:hypothetical protein